MEKKMSSNQITKTVHMKNPNQRYPNLSTILMVEKVLKKHRDLPMTLAELKAKLPKPISAKKVQKAKKTVAAKPATKT